MFDLHERSGRRGWPWGLPLLLVITLPCFATGSSPDFKKGVLEKTFKIAKDSEGRLKLSLDSTAIDLDQFIRAGQFSEGVGITASRAGGQVQFRALSEPVEIQWPDFNDARVRIGPNDELEARIDLARTILDLRAGPKNSNPIFIALDDGGAAELKPGSNLRLDAFADSTYYIADRVGGGLAAGWSAEGQAWKLSPKLLPMTGGPLRSFQQAGFKRKTPELPTQISGALESDAANLTVRCGKEVFSLAPGERHLAKDPNGTRAEFYYDPDRLALRCSVQKGYLEVQTTGIDCCQTICLSGQSVEWQWDASLHTVDVKNDGSTPILANLPHHGLAQIDPHATLQMACINTFTYGTAAVGGHVTLLNTDSGETTPLEQNNKLFVGGRLSTGAQSAASGRTETMTLTWDRGTPVEIHFEGKSVIVPPGAQKIVEVDPTTQIALNYDPRGQLQVVAVQGNFDIHMSALSGMAVRLTQGDSAAMTLDMQKGVFNIQTSQQNQAPVQLTTPQGWTPQLGASENLRLTLGKDGSMVATSENRLVAFEPAGTIPTVTATATAAAAPTPATVVTKQEDVVRIVQPPLSPAGPQ